MVDKNAHSSGWFVYILYCSDGSLYTGITTDLQRRVDEHNDGKQGARYTRARRPVSLVWFEPCASRSEATTREAEIKNLDRDRKSVLVIEAWRKNKTELKQAGADQSLLNYL